MKKFSKNLNNLTDEQYSITQNHNTEPPFSGKYLNNIEKGIYKCVVCENPLFFSESKYNSGTGWPSFYETINTNSVGTNVDKSYFMVRTEVHCIQCKAHLGHVFSDGPEPTGLRYCINSLSLNFKKSN